MKLNDLTRGLIAGAAGTVALNVLTYLDMTVRARPSSTLPEQTAESLADAADVELAPRGDGRTRESRSQGLGALMGYVSGLGLGAAYGVVAPDRGRVPVSAGALGLGLAAMTAANVPAVATGVTDPRQWTRQAWAADAIPHLAYGLVTAGVLHALRSRAG